LEDSCTCRSNHPTPPRPSSLSLHDALPIFVQRARAGHGDVGRASDHRIEPVIAVGLGGPQHRAAAIGDARRDDSGVVERERGGLDRKSTRLNSSHVKISYAVFCLKKKTHTT